MGDAVSTYQELDADIIHEALWGQPPGSGRAFAQLYELYEPRVRYAVARAAHQCGYVHRIDELRQDVWCRMLDRDRKLLRYYKPECGPLGAFIVRIAYQQALGAAQVDRRQSGNKPRELQTEILADERTSTFVAQVVQSDLYKKLMERAFAELGERDLLVLREVHLNQRRLNDVADEHGLSPSPLYKRNERLKKKLAAWCDELLADPSPDSPSPSTAVLIVLIFTALATRGEDLPPASSSSHSTTGPDHGNLPAPRSTGLRSR